MAGESARFGVSEARWSLYPMGGSAVRPPRQISYTALRHEWEYGQSVFASEDAKEGPLAFSQKRKPGFKRR